MLLLPPLCELWAVGRCDAAACRGRHGFITLAEEQAAQRRQARATALRARLDAPVLASLRQVEPITWNDSPGLTFERVGGQWRGTALEPVRLAILDENERTLPRGEELKDAIMQNDEAFLEALLKRTVGAQRAQDQLLEPVQMKQRRARWRLGAVHRLLALAYVFFVAPSRPRGLDTDVATSVGDLARAMFADLDAALGRMMAERYEELKQAITTYLWAEDHAADPSARRSTAEAQT